MIGIARDEHGVSTGCGFGGEVERRKGGTNRRALLTQDSALGCVNVIHNLFISLTSTCELKINYRSWEISIDLNLMDI